MVLNRSHELLKRSVPVIKVWDSLGLKRKDNSAPCFKPEEHKNNDNHWSVSFHQKTNTFRCWLEHGIGGDNFNLLFQSKGMTFPKAKIYLENLSAGIKYIPQEIQAKLIEDELRFAIYADFISLCRPVLNVPNASDYLLRQRGMSEVALSSMGVSCVVSHKDTLGGLLTKYTLEQLTHAGLLNAKGELYFSELDYALVFPYFREDKVVFLQGRIIGNSDAYNRYHNIRAHLPSIYNTNVLKSLGQTEALYLAEGPTDTLSLISNNMKAVGLAGCKTVKIEFLDLLLPYSIVLCLDHDTAGANASALVQNYYKRKGKTVPVFDFPNEFKDVSDYFSSRRSLC
ncbi:MAG: hypothetical protein A2452_08965 [Candidatus Firestonebacteria bacterium RIFOXYC2_FULL_39_67]|nr:MAG: hypothetical protein A2536_09535 [Candidatus Firestonebacteria bacterium RIFOXYD2_FULL_39_29]OGF53580.1 MAG: hypothetical protein A2452_08965 [Candidatus Firestonebacteria bacterium RIFOXYC2_FULL_39_67]